MSRVQKITVKEEEDDQRLDRWLKKKFPNLKQYDKTVFSSFLQTFRRKLSGGARACARRPHVLCGRADARVRQGRGRPRARGRLRGPAHGEARDAAAPEAGARGGPQGRVQQQGYSGPS